MQKKSILFVCLGNICRSPTAEGIFKQIIHENQLEKSYTIDSAGLISIHQGELSDRRMSQHASQRGYKLHHRSRPVTISDFEKFDMIIGMDEDNIAGLLHLAQTDHNKAKIFRMTDFLENMEASHIPDPYYGGDKGFQNVIDLLEDACNGLFKALN